MPAAIAGAATVSIPRVHRHARAGRWTRGRAGSVPFAEAGRISGIRTSGSGVHPTAWCPYMDPSRVARLWFVMMGKDLVAAIYPAFDGEGGIPSPGPDGFRARLVLVTLSASTGRWIVQVLKAPV